MTDAYWFALGFSIFSLKFTECYVLLRVCLNIKCSSSFRIEKKKEEAFIAFFYKKYRERNGCWKFLEAKQALMFECILREESWQTHLTISSPFSAREPHQIGGSLGSRRTSSYEHKIS